MICVCPRKDAAVTKVCEPCDCGMVIMSDRKPWYGEGRQPIDDIMEAGWGPEFCAGNVLKYLRRTKSPEHSLESAKVYYGWLKGLAEVQRKTGDGHAIGVYNALVMLLNDEELERLHR